MKANPEKLKQIIEGALLAAGRPLGVDQLLALFLDEDQPSRDEIREALQSLQHDSELRGIELKEVSSGFRYQVKSDLAEWVGRLWEEKPARYSRAVLETLALIAYRQPITRSEIEDVRGVSVSSHIVKSLLEREWIRVIGHRDVPGKPALYGTTKIFLDYFGLTSLSDLPPLAELRNIESIERELDFGDKAQMQPGEVELSGDADAVSEPSAAVPAVAVGEAEEASAEPESESEPGPGDDVVAQQATSDTIEETVAEESVVEAGDSDTEAEAEQDTAELPIVADDTTELRPDQEESFVDVVSDQRASEESGVSDMDVESDEAEASKSEAAV